MSAYDYHTYFTSNGTYTSINQIVSRVGDFSRFYIVIAICSFILTSLIILKVVCCCSEYSDYWLDRHTGNCWILSIWSTTPYKQPPLDLTELQNPYQDVQYEYPDDGIVFRDAHSHDPEDTELQNPYQDVQYEYPDDGIVFRDAHSHDPEDTELENQYQDVQYEYPDDGIVFRDAHSHDPEDTELENQYQGVQYEDPDDGIVYRDAYDQPRPRSDWLCLTPATHFIASILRIAPERE